MSETALPRRKAPSAGIAPLLSDEHLARRAAEGDERAFAAIFGRYHQRLYRYCLAILGNPEDAQDALQNAMVKALRALPGEERRIELKPWLHRIAHNESIDQLRRRHQVERLDPELAAAGVGLTEKAELRERLRGLIADLGQLPERQRAALVMRELSGLGFEEIGAALGTSAAGARQIVYEARLGLRQIDAGREMDCDEVTRALSDGDRRAARRRDIRTHLRGCASCRTFAAGIGGRRRDLAALSPLPAVAAAGILQGLLGGGGGAAGGGLAAALGLGGAKTLGTSAALKATATVAAVAALGAATADRGGIVDLGLPGGGERSGAAGEETVATAQRDDLGAGEAGAGAAFGDGSKANGTGGDRPEVGEQRARTKGQRGGGSREHGAGASPATLPVPSEHQARPVRAGGPEAGLPAASAHGRQTAAAHKNAAHGASGSHPATPSHPTPPTKPGQAEQPPKPASPPKSAPEKTSPLPPSSGSDKGASRGQENAAPQAEGAAKADSPHESSKNR
jgi:RNA polymerase sigma factor (sigma-70 family)